jgi:hypothetical protein
MGRIQEEIHTDRKIYAAWVPQGDWIRELAREEASRLRGELSVDSLSVDSFRVESCGLLEAPSVLWKGFVASFDNYLARTK